MPVFRILMVLLAGTALARGAELHTLTGKTVSGDLVSVSEKEVVLRARAGPPVATPVSEILVVDCQHEAVLPGGRYSDVQLSDGTLLHAGSFALKGKEVELKLAGSGRVVRVPLATVAWVLNDAQDAATQRTWREKFLSKRRNQDLVVLKGTGGVLNGVEGTLGEGNARGEIHFAFGPANNPRARDVDPGRLQGMIFLRRPDPDAPVPVCRVHDTNRNVLVAARLALTPAGLAVTTVAGPTLECPREALVRLDFSNDKIVFLSDLKPVEVIQKSKQGRLDLLRLDRNLENGPLQIQEKPYSKGLALHAYTELVYDLDGKYNTFEAVLGMDAMVGGNGHPVVRIEADGRELFTRTVSRQDAPQVLKLDVRGARQLRIVISANGLFDFGAHVDLANAKLSQ